MVAGYPVAIRPINHLRHNKWIFLKVVHGGLRVFTFISVSFDWDAAFPFALHSFLLTGSIYCVSICRNEQGGESPGQRLLIINEQ